MAGLVGKYAANKLLKKHMKQYENKKVESGQDPFFAYVEDPRKPGKLKKVKKQIPAYIPEHDAMILASVRKRAYQLDCGLFEIFGIRFGWESIIGLVPFAGDAIGVALALLVVKKCMKVEGGLGQALLIRMMINVAIDFLVGLIPFVGDLADAAFKCNTKNLRLLEEHLDGKHKPSSLKRDERDFAGVDKQTRMSNRKSGIYMPNDPPPATAFDDSDIEDNLGRHNGTEAQAPRVQEPLPAIVPEDRRGGDRGGWFSGSKSKREQRDTELRPDVRSDRR
ncbi:uncharacterized protein SEPMUDRAFT_124184 [Sphaerulina musiva SO2202]|uniref:PH domain-containing protein n=1 Tax=Sphaerulina musiva (strain SO2202) TaxID=692275 RepID=M3C746_SPHMS|nr:uncharacterized protein SEPMUDRAFT_124184 [Sphaerulina musiva SO2202]EMF16076.1 hypothetical protein SEPMUDRAFT_124184 [Sphaerulina musiva SO2202]